LISSLCLQTEAGLDDYSGSMLATMDINGPLNPSPLIAMCTHPVNLLGACYLSSEPYPEQMKDGLAQRNGWYIAGRTYETAN
jgi:hypothetical protein